MKPYGSPLARAGMVAISAIALALPMAASLTNASSHREAPLISNDPAADTTDMYVFRSPDAQDTVTAIMNVYPFGLPEQGPNFYLFDPSVRYSMHITNSGAATEALRLDFRFRTDIRGRAADLQDGPITSIDDENFLTRQFYSVDLVKGGQATRLGENLPVAPPNPGPKTFPEGYDKVANQAIINIPSIPGGKVFAGPRDDPFFIDIGSIFDLFNAGRGLPTGAKPGIDNLAGYNVLSIAVQVPIAAILRPECNIGDAKDMDCVVGMWITTSRPKTNVLNGENAPTTSGDFIQIGRQSAALVNETVVPTAMKDAFGASDPKNDERFLGLVQDPLPARALNKIFNLPVPSAPRQDIVTIFLTGIPELNQPPNVEPAEIAHLNLAVPITSNPNRLGLLGNDTQGYPNGRRLADDAVDISLRALAGGTPFTPDFNKAPNNQLSDGVNQNDKAFLTTFPYLAAPHQGFDHQHDRTASQSGAAAPAPQTTQPAAPSAVGPAAPPRTGNSALAASSIIYTVQDGDTLASISEAVYGVPDRAEDILTNNLDVISDPTALEPGTVLVLQPEVSQDPEGEPTEAQP